MRHPGGELAALCLALSALAAPARAAMSIYASPEAIAGRAEVVVRGTVVRVDSGVDPFSGGLATYATIAVDETLRGPADLAEVVVREPGGRFGNLVHVVDAVPEYRPGEEVVAFLEPSRDGALRTAGMFFGKYTVERSGVEIDAVRDLDGRGLVWGRPSYRPERFRLTDLEALAAGPTRVPRARRTPRRETWSARPPELERVVWDGGTADDGTNVSRFVTLSTAAPARWYEADTGTAVLLDVDPARNPLGNASAAVTAIERATTAWTDVPESRIEIRVGSGTVAYSAASSPAKVYPSRNIVLFGDPYGDIADPSGCSGVLAIGGYWRSGTAGAPVNGVTFYPALRMYVIFANGFECFLGDPDNLAEIATHEIGHGLGLGHSTEPDAIMRSTAYGGRGPRLGDDDRDAAHCLYPHTLRIVAPNGGEHLEAGTVAPVTWTSTTEAGPDPGTLDVEYSIDGGSAWDVAAADETDDGAYSWLVPDRPGAAVRLRVARHARGGGVGPPFPESCSNDASDGLLSIDPPPPVAGEIPEAPGMALGKTTGGALWFSWAPSCSPEATDYAIYQGTLAALRSGVSDLVSRTCSAGTDLVETLSAPPGSVYFLVAPRTATAEGGLGSDTGGIERGAASVPCLPREKSNACP